LLVPINSISYPASAAEYPQPYPSTEKAPPSPAGPSVKRKRDAASRKLAAPELTAMGSPAPPLAGYAASVHHPILPAPAGNCETFGEEAEHLNAGREQVKPNAIVPSPTVRCSKHQMDFANPGLTPRDG